MDNGIPAADGEVRCCVDCEVSAVELPSSVVDVTNEYITVARGEINSVLLSREFAKFHAFVQLTRINQCRKNLLISFLSSFNQYT